MTYRRQNFASPELGLAFSMEVPPGLVADAADSDGPGPDARLAPVALLVSPLEPATLAVAVRPADGRRSVEAWARGHAEASSVTAAAVARTELRGVRFPHPAVMIEGHETRAGTLNQTILVALEDGGTLIVLHARCPKAIWPDYGPWLRDTMLSFELEDARGPTLPLAPGESVPPLVERSPSEQQEMSKDPYERYLEGLAKTRAPAMKRAMELVEAERYDQADEAVKAADGSIYGEVALAKMYREHLAVLVAAGRHHAERARAEAVFRRALKWAESAYPEPHTEVEAENYERGRAEDLADLVKILGYQPAEE